MFSLTETGIPHTPQSLRRWKETVTDCTFIEPFFQPLHLLTIQNNLIILIETFNYVFWSEVWGKMLRAVFSVTLHASKWCSSVRSWCWTNGCTGFMDIKKCNFWGPWDNGLKLLQLILLMLAEASLIMHNYIVPISYELWAIKTLIHFNKILIFSFSLSCSVSLCFLSANK